MTIELFAHPFSAYVQKVLIPLYASDTPFTLRMLDPDHVENGSTFAALWPLMRMPVLREGGRVVVESTIIVEYLDQHHPGPVPMIPAAGDAALEARMMDRFFDNYVMTPMQKIVGDSLRAPADRDAYGVAEAKKLLTTSYRWLDGVMAKRQQEGQLWAAGNDFSLADCAAAPALFYADWVHPIDAQFDQTRAFRARLLAHPAVIRAVDGGRPYRHLFPLGAPDRD